MCPQGEMKDFGAAFIIELEWNHQSVQLVQSAFPPFVGSWSPAGGPSSCMSPVASTNPLADGGAQAPSSILSDSNPRQQIPTRDPLTGFYQRPPPPHGLKPPAVKKAANAPKVTYTRFSHVPNRSPVRILKARSTAFKTIDSMGASPFCQVRQTTQDPCWPKPKYFAL